MDREKFIEVKEAHLTNNCPECYNQEIKLTFYQKHRFGRLSHRATNEVTHELKCKKCHSVIYPVKWTEDIERVFEYYQKMVVMEKTSLKFTPLFYALILICLALVAIGAYLFMEGIIPF